MEGTWTGIGQQSNSTSWTIRLTVSGNSYKIEYPSLSCGGHWSLTRQAQFTASFIEHITYGRDKCIDGGEVTVGCSRGCAGTAKPEMLYHWTGSGQAANARLIFNIPR